jgi:hypothetical protein
MKGAAGIRDQVFQSSTRTWDAGHRSTPQGDDLRLPVAQFIEKHLDLPSAHDRLTRSVRGPAIFGKRACGGVWGYANLVEALLDPKHPDHEDLRNWIRRGWGPEIFKASDVRFDNPTRRWKLAFLRDD